MFKETHKREFKKETKKLFDRYLLERKDIDYGSHEYSHESFVKVTNELSHIIGPKNFKILNDALILYNEKKRREKKTCL